MRYLIIVESPSKAVVIKKYLQSLNTIHIYDVVASSGHINGLKSLEDIDVKNHFNCKYELLKGKKTVLEKIKNKIEKTDEVIIGTDDDNEGEAIGYHLCNYFDLDLSTTKRIVFHEITPSSLLKALQQPRTIDMNIIQAQQTRQIIDLMIGYTISPILWKKINYNKDNPLSSGRCQSVALRMIYENHKHNEKNEEEEQTFKVKGYFTDLEIPFELTQIYDNKIDFYYFFELSKTYKCYRFITDKRETITKLYQPPEPFSTSLLYQQAHSLLHFSSKETAFLAQELYENGLITYIRTPSKKYSKEFSLKLENYIKEKYGQNKTIPYNQDENKDAHEAIRPVNLQLIEKEAVFSVIPDTKYRSKVYKLYKMIWTNTIQSFMKPCITSILKTYISSPLENVFYENETEKIVEKGFREITQTKEINTNYDYLQNLNLLSKNVVCSFIEGNEKRTRINQEDYYTEGSLIKKLEMMGIGRSSTFASIVSKNQERNYVKKEDIEGRKYESDYVLLSYKEPITITTEKRITKENDKKERLVIQPLGIVVIEFLMEQINQNKLFDYDFTKRMEDSLESIQYGEEKKENVCNEIHETLNQTIERLKQNEKWNNKYLDENQKMIFTKSGDILIKEEKEGNVLLYNIEKMGNNEILKNQVITEKDFGLVEGKQLKLKKGRYGLYIEHGGSVKKSISKQFGNRPIENITLEELQPFLIEDNKDITKEFIRRVSENITIRNGRYGDYIFYKTKQMKTPVFYKLKGFDEDYKTCNISLLKNWIQEKYKII